MQSGIYKLIFSSGNYYIGKSEDIPTRWKQHTAQFEKGSHSRRMQDEYYKCGHPKGVVLVECHKDHIDLMESIYIEDNRGPNCLNGNAPKAIPPVERSILLGDTADTLKFPTAIHIKTLHDQALKNIALEEELTQLKTNGVMLPEVAKQAMLDADQLIKELEPELQAHKELVEKYKSLPLWKRIFSYNV